jgi:hypothetical protein
MRSHRLELPESVVSAITSFINTSGWEVAQNAVGALETAQDDYDGKLAVAIDNVNQVKHALDDREAVADEIVDTELESLVNGCVYGLAHAFYLHKDQIHLSAESRDALNDLTIRTHY